MKLSRIFLPLVIAVISAGCTCNDGDIGPWFGSWSMSEMTVDGRTPDGFDPTATVWEFQSSLIRISLLGEHHTMDDMSWGTWHESDGHLYLDYTHPSDKYENSNGEYEAPSWLLIQKNSVADLAILERGKRRMTLEYITPEGEKVVYTLKKTW